MWLVKILFAASTLLALNACGLVPSDGSDLDPTVLILSEGDGTETGNAADYLSIKAVSLSLNSQLIIEPEISFSPGDIIECGYELDPADSILPPEVTVAAEFILPTLDSYIEDGDPWTFTYDEFLSYGASSAGLRCSVSLYFDGKLFFMKISEPVVINKSDGFRSPGSGGTPPLDDGKGTSKSDPSKP